MSVAEQQLVKYSFFVDEGVSDFQTLLLDEILNFTWYSHRQALKNSFHRKRTEYLRHGTLSYRYTNAHQL
jgi:hypothetical protein